MVFALTLATHLPLALAHRTPSGAKAGPEPGLLDVPATFHRGIPILRVRVAGKGARGERLLMLDSGATESILLIASAAAGSTRSELRVFADASRASDLGTVRFFPRVGRSLGPSAEAWLRSVGAQGFLGQDFFLTHDVLIDYEREKVCISPRRSRVGERSVDVSTPPPPEVLDRYPRERFVGSSLLELPAGYCAPVAIGTRSKSVLSFPILDTGAQVTALPTTNAPHARPPDAPDARVVGAEQDHLGWTEKSQAWISSIDRPFELDVNYVADAVAVLAPVELGRRVFLSLRRSAFWIGSRYGPEERGRAARPRSGDGASIATPVLSGGAAIRPAGGSQRRAVSTTCGQASPRPFGGYGAVAP